MTVTKAITLDQPYPALIVAGVKGSDADRFWSKVDAGAEDSCWHWTGSRHERGYGLFRVGSRTDGSARLVRAHRLAYELTIGPIPDGLVIDHVCMNPPCVNPTHLEAVTQAENMRRFAAKRSACQNGHPWTDDSFVVTGQGHRTCAVCLSSSRARAKERRRAVLRGGGGGR